MRSSLVLAITLLFLLGSSVSRADAQDLPRPRTAAELAVGIGTKVPSWGEQGVGPYVSATLRVPAGSSRRVYLAGIGYGIVFTGGWTSPDGVHYDSALEAVLLHLGHEWPLDRRGDWALDAQWNPALARVRRWGEQPAWRSGSSDWEASFATTSVGLRWTVPRSGGPVVGLSLRAFAQLNPNLLMAGEFHAWPVLTVTLR